MTISAPSRHLDHAAVRRRRALDYGIDQLKRAANALQAARGSSDSMRDAVIEDAHRRLESMQRELRALE